MNEPVHHELDDDQELDLELDRELDRTDPQFAATLAESLAQLMQIPADLASRTNVSVNDSMLERSLLGTATDLLSIGWQTIGLLSPTLDTALDTTPAQRSQDTPT